MKLTGLVTFTQIFFLKALHLHLAGFDSLLILKKYIMLSGFQLPTILYKVVSDHVFALELAFSRRSDRGDGAKR